MRVWEKIWRETSRTPENKGLPATASLPAGLQDKGVLKSIEEGRELLGGSIGCNSHFCEIVIDLSIKCRLVHKPLHDLHINGKSSA